MPRDWKGHQSGSTAKKQNGLTANYPVEKDMIMRLFFAFALMITALPAHAGSKADVEDLMSWMSGHFSSAQQVAENPDARMRHVFGTRVDLPNVPGDTVYLEWHAGTADGPIDSQRIWSYQAKGDRIEMRFYTFLEKADAALTGITSSGEIPIEAVKSLTLEDFFSYPEECVFTMYRNGDVIEGKNGVGDCRIFNRSLDVWMRPDVTVRFEPGRIYEAGVYSYESADDGGKPPETLTIVQDFRRME